MLHCKVYSIVQLYVNWPINDQQTKKEAIFFIHLEND